ncbi:hypothetical protein AOQ84DRAFT_203751 [Glonium stellatum]|uniref:Uncharacterized protein n=1 Tax=Glonium stellatum TaxID=574774 RepID=A0A8E2EN56_9PEZI|nr:hypothetical protein AOQ84DRAFT_203751 [Glonium stellatum]
MSSRGSPAEMLRSRRGLDSLIIFPLSQLSSTYAFNGPFNQRPLQQLSLDWQGKVIIHPDLLAFFQVPLSAEPRHCHNEDISHSRRVFALLMSFNYTTWEVTVHHGHIHVYRDRIRL